MKLILSFLLLLIPTPLIVSLKAQNPPAETYQPGFWQPVARFDSQRAVEVNIINNTDIKLEYDITDLEFTNPRSIEPGQIGNLQGFGNSAYIVIYPLASSYGDFTLRFDIVVDEDKNIVTISVVKDQPSFFGHRAINLQKTGAIFIH